jgi:hypothetical protein
MSHLNIPMNPADFPQQKLYQVKSLPIMPDDYCVEIMNYEQEHSLAGIPKKPTKKSIPLAQVEWSWSPMHSRVDSYELHKGKEHWLLWCGGPDDNACTYISNWFAVSAMPVKGISQEQAAIHLLLAFWEYESGHMSLDHYHWINWAGALSVSDLQSIANEVWKQD